MLGSLQAKIIGILRIEFEKDPEKFLSIKEIHNLLKDSSGSLPTSSIKYNTIATILKRLSEQDKVNSYSKSNRFYYQYRDIQKQVSDRLLSTFIRAFGMSGVTHLIERSQNLTEEDINDLMNLIDEDQSKKDIDND